MCADDFSLISGSTNCFIRHSNWGVRVLCMSSLEGGVKQRVLRNTSGPNGDSNLPSLSPGEALALPKAFMGLNEAVPGDGDSLFSLKASACRY